MRTPKAVLSLFLFFLTPALLWAMGAKDYEDAGMALYRAGQYAKAVDYFKNAVQADPNDWVAYADLGDAYSKLGDTANARQAYQNSLNINPNNSDVRASLESLSGGASPQDSSNFNTLSQDHPAMGSTPAPNSSPSGVKKFEEEGTVTQQAEPWRQHPGAVSAYSSSGGMSPMDRSKVWLKFDGGYNYAYQTDLLNSASAENQLITSAGGSGSSLADRNGYRLGMELGFLFNPYSGMGIGLGYLQTNNYHFNTNLGNGPATLGGTAYGSDFEDESMTPTVVPLTLDLYFFLPDGGGRFFLSAGAGLYFGKVHVEDNYSYIISSYSNGDPNYANNFDTFSGDLYSTGAGFQAGLGREFAISPHFGISLYGRGRYARLTNFRGTVYNPNNGGSADDGLAHFSDGSVHSTDVSNIGNNGVSYATLDFTGFDVGIAFTFYTY